MTKPFKSRKETAKGFQKNPPRVFKKQDKIADFVRSIQGELPPFKIRKNAGGAFDKHRGPTNPDNRTPEQKRKDREKLQAERRGGPDKSSGSANLSGVKRYRKNGGAIMKARGGTFKGTF